MIAGVAIPGGYAEYVVLPARNLVSLPEAIDFASGAILANAVGTPYHALKYRMRLQPGERLIVTGAGGGVGLHAIQVAVMIGAEVMAVDLGQAKLTAASNAGAVEAIDPRIKSIDVSAMKWTDGLGVDGGPRVGRSRHDAQDPGVVVEGRPDGDCRSHTGSNWTIDPGDIYRNEWEIKGSRNVSAKELAEVVELVVAGSLRPVVDGTFPLEAAEELQRNVTSGKVIGRQVLIP